LRFKEKSEERITELEESLQDKVITTDEKKGISPKEFDKEVKKIITWQEALESIKYAIQQGNMSYTKGFFNGRTNYHDIFELSSINKSLSFYYRMSGKRNVSKPLKLHFRNKIFKLKAKAKEIERRLSDFNGKHKVKVTLPENIMTELLKL